MRLIIGYGNPLRADDRLGQFLAETVANDWTLITSHQLTPELAEPISRAERVVFIDACVGDTPGEVLCSRVDPTTGADAFTHTVTPASLLAGASTLYGTAPAALMITVTGASFEFGFDFSPRIAALLPQIICRVGALIAEFDEHLISRR